MHADRMADDPAVLEQVLTRLPIPFSLASRLRDDGVAEDMICLYLGVDAAELDDFYRIAEAKLLAAQCVKLDVAAPIYESLP